MSRHLAIGADVGGVGGAVLCGGASRRMGRDKALIEVDGRPMVLRVVDSLAAGGCRPAVAVGGDADALAALGLTVVADRFPADGPVGGVLTALEYLRESEVVIIAACDLPRLTAPTVAALVRALLADGQLDVAIAADNRRQALCGAWRPAARVQLEASFAAGERRLRAAVVGLRMVEVAVPADELVNVNTPADLGQ